MGDYELMTLAVVIAMIGGAIAAKLTHVVLWKGILVAAAAAAAAVAAFFVPGMERSLSMPLAGLAGAGLTGMLLGLSAPTTANILIGAAVPPMLGFVLMEINA